MHHLIKRIKCALEAVFCYILYNILPKKNLYLQMFIAMPLIQLTVSGFCYIINSTPSPGLLADNLLLTLVMKHLVASIPQVQPLYAVQQIFDRIDVKCDVEAIHDEEWNRVDTQQNWRLNISDGSERGLHLIE